MKHLYFWLTGLLILIPNLIFSESVPWTGSYSLEFLHNDITNRENIFSYDRGLTAKYNLVFFKEESDYQVSGMQNLFYNKAKPIRKLDFESLRYEISRKKDNLIIGDNYPNYSEFTISNTRLRGLNYRMNKEGSAIELFASSSNAAEQPDRYYPTAEYEQYIMGFKIDVDANIDIVKSNKINFIFFHSEDDPSSIDTGTPSTGPIKNSVFSFQDASQITDKINVQLEIAKSIYDNNKRLDSDYISHCNAYNFDFNYLCQENMNLKFNFKNYQKDFYTAGNSTLNSSFLGYKGGKIDFEYLLDKYSIQSNLEMYSEESQDSNIETDYNIFSLITKYNLNPIRALTFDYNFRITKKDDLTVNTNRNKIKVSLNDKLGNANFSLSMDYAKTNDRTFLNISNLKTYGASFSLSNRVNSKNLFYNIYLLWNNNESPYKTTKFYLANLNTNFDLIPQKLKLLLNNNFKLNDSGIDKAKTFTNEANFYYYIDFKNSLKLLLKNERQVDSESDYNVKSISLNFTKLF